MGNAMGRMMLAEIRKETKGNSSDFDNDTIVSIARKSPNLKKKNNKTKRKKELIEIRTFEGAYSDKDLVEVQAILCEDLNEEIKEGSGRHTIKKLLKLAVADRSAFLVCLEGKKPSPS